MLFLQKLREKDIRIKNSGLDNYIKRKEFSFLPVTEILTFEKYQIIFQNIQHSELIIINYFNELNQKPEDGYFVAAFKDTILIVSQSNLNFLHNILVANPKLKFIFNSDSVKDNFNNNINIQYDEGNYQLNNYKDVIENFKKELALKNQPKELIWGQIIECISVYLILNSYKKASKRINDDQIQIRDDIDESEYIKLKQLGNTTTNSIDLIYHIENELLLVVKYQSCLDKERCLAEREIENYKKLNYPLFPKFFGTNDKGHIFIEYIKGQTLSEIKKLNLKYDDKIKILFDIAKSLTYLHLNDLVYRDLKPNNVIITDEKVPVLIDFDRLINCDSIDQSENTIYWGDFLAPELADGSSTIRYENDVFSFGKMIYYVLFEKKPKDDVKEEDFGSYQNFFDFYSMCTEQYKERPPIILFLFNQLKNCRDLIQELPNNLYFAVENGKIMPTYKTTNDQYLLSMFSIIYQSYGYKIISLGFLIQSTVERSRLYFYLLNSIFKEEGYDQISTDDYESIKQLFEYNFYSGLIYLEIDVLKAIEHLNIAVENNFEGARVLLSFFYYDGVIVDNYVFKASLNVEIEKECISLFGIFYLSNIQKINIPDIFPINEYFQIYFKSLKKDEKFFLDKGINYIIKSASKGDDNASNFISFLFLISISPDNQELMSDIQFYEFAQKILEKLKDYGMFDTIMSALKSFASKCPQIASFLCYYYLFQNFDLQKAIQYGKIADRNDNNLNFVLGFIYFLRALIVDDPYFSFKDVNILIGLCRSVLKKIIYSDPKGFDDIFNFIQNIFKSISNIQNDKSAAEYFLKAASKDESYKGISSFLLAMLNKQTDFNMVSEYYKNFPPDLGLSEEYFKAALIMNCESIIGDRNRLDKAIEYMIEGANKHDVICNYCLGLIYKKGLLIFYKPNLDRSIKYLTFSADRLNIQAHYELAVQYEQKGKEKGNISEIKKALDHYVYAAKNGNSDAQYVVGLYYLTGKHFYQDIKKGIVFLKNSFNNKNADAIFALGYLYLVGCESEIEQDIDKSVCYFKEGSNRDHLYSKNNLGIIYKNGYAKGFKKNLNNAIEYFQEAIKLYKYYDCPVERYNLAHIFLYNYNNKDKIQEAIKLLVRSSKRFMKSKDLLCIALIRKYGQDISPINIQNEIKNAMESKFFLVPEELSEEIWYKINKENWFDKFNAKNEEFRNIDYCYEFPSLQPFISNNILKGTKKIEAPKPNPKVKEINEEFKDGLSNLEENLPALEK